MNGASILSILNTKGNWHMQRTAKSTFMNHAFLICPHVLLGLLIFSRAVVNADPFYHEGVPAVVPSSGGGETAQVPGMALPAFAPLVKQLSPAVVNISVEADPNAVNDDTPDAAPPSAPMPGFPFFKKDGSSPVRSLGSGFIISEDGYIVTNNHVIDKANKIVVRLLDDKTPYIATAQGIDEKTDLALIKISVPENRKLKTVFIGDSDAVDVGDWVLAIGNQFQLGQTVTAGIVSAKARRVPTGSPYDAFIQTDASINPGSSGGPLFNTKGQVIGINTAIFSPGRAQYGGAGFNIGIGFAIPINLAKRIITQLKDSHKVTRGLLGVLIQRIDNDVAEALNLKTADGALVSDVLADTPAAAAGFKVRDVITKFDGHAVTEHDELPLMVANTEIGSTVQVEVIRDGALKVLTATITELKDKGPKKEQTKKTAEMKPNEIGLLLDEVTEDLAKALNLDTNRGVVVQGVEPGSVADNAGFARGDVILEINGQVVSDLNTFNRVLSVLPRGKAALVLIKKPDGTRFLTIKRK